MTTAAQSTTRFSTTKDGVSMNWHSCLKRGVIGFAPLIPLLLLVCLFVASPAQAAGGLAMSGSFYNQDFEIPQGSSVSAPSVYVVVFNQGDEAFGVRMSWEAPVGVNITLSDDDFTLGPGEQQKVLIGVEVSHDAAPGEYEISVTAESYKQGGDGIQVMGAAGQSATLVVLGNSASVTAQTVSPDGEPVVAVVRLFKVIDDRNYEVAYSETGTLDATVAPGSFLASAYVGGENLAEESFSVATDEEKTVTLTVGTIYFEGFGIVPNYHTKTGELAFAQIVYTVRNLYQPVADAEIILLVTRDGASLEETSLATLSPLDIGRAGLNYNYIPSGGWADGSYGFKLQLKLDGEPYATTLEEQFDVSDGGAAGGGDGGGGGINAALIVGIAVAVLAVGAIGYLLVRRRRV